MYMIFQTTRDSKQRPPKQTKKDKGVDMDKDNNNNDRREEKGLEDAAERV